MNINTLLASLRRNQDGVAFVEMALSLPLLMLLCLGMIDVSRLVTSKIDLELASQQTVDYILAKRPTDGKTAKYVTEAASAAGVTKTQVQVTFWLECDGSAQTKVTGECVDGEESSRYAYIEISDNVETSFNWSKMASFFDGKERASTVLVVGDATVRYQ